MEIELQGLKQLCENKFLPISEIIDSLLDFAEVLVFQALFHTLKGLDAIEGVGVALLEGLENIHEPGHFFVVDDDFLLIYRSKQPYGKALLALPLLRVVLLKIKSEVFLKIMHFSKHDFFHLLRHATQIL